MSVVVRGVISRVTSAGPKRCIASCAREEGQEGRQADHAGPAGRRTITMRKPPARFSITSRPP